MWSGKAIKFQEQLDIIRFFRVNGALLKKSLQIIVQMFLEKQLIVWNHKFATVKMNCRMGHLKLKNVFK